MKRNIYHVPGSLYVEQIHPKKWGFFAWKPNTSQFFNDKKLLLKFVAWSKGTPTGDEFRAWLEESTANTETADVVPDQSPVS